MTAPLIRTASVVAIGLACHLAAAPTPAGLADAEILYGAQRWDEARAAYEQVLPTLGPDDRALAHNRIGMTWQRRGDYEAAVASHQAVIDADDAPLLERAEAMLQIGLCRSLQRQYQAAIDQLQQLAVLPEAPANHRLLAHLRLNSNLRKLGRVEEALDQLRAALMVDDASGNYQADARLSLAHLLIERKAYTEAIAVLQPIATISGATRTQMADAAGYIAECEVHLQGPQPFYIRPYVIHVSGTSATVCWASHGEFEDGLVALHDGGESVTAQVETEPVWKTDAFMHRARFDALRPGTRYHYDVDCGKQTEHASFATATPPGQPITFAVTGDTQSAPDLHLAVATAMARDEPDFAVHVGDLTDRGSIWSKWRAELFDPGRPYFERCAFYPAVGNHDGGAFFPLLFETGKKFYYSFRQGDAHFCVLDSYWAGAGRSGRAAQLAWLEQEFTATDAHWKIVVLHVPMAATNATVKWFGLDDFMPAMETLGVDLVLSGHHPMYRRYLPIGSPGRKPTIHVTTGGGGPVGDPLPSPLLVRGAGSSHHSLVRIHGNRLELMARRPDGVEIDRLVLEKDGAGLYQPEIMRLAVDLPTAYSLRNVYAELLTKHRGELLTAVTAAVQPGAEATFTFDLSSLPNGGLDPQPLPTGLQLLVAAPAGSQWRIERQAMLLAQPRQRFRASAPPDLIFAAGRLQPPLRVQLNLRLGEREFEPVVAEVRLDDDSQKYLAALTGEMPLHWQFKLDPHDVGLAEGWSRTMPADGLQELRLSAWWEDQLKREYDGLGWYWAELTAPDVAAGQRLWLEFGAIDESCVVWVNGEQVGEQVYDTNEDDGAWEKPRRFDVTDQVHAKQNLVAVRVQDLSGMGGIYRGCQWRVTPVNLVPRGSLSELEKWQHSPSLELAADNGRYVGNHALRVRTAATDGSVGRRLPLAAAAGRYQLALTVRAVPVPGSRPAVTFLQLSLPDGQPLEVRPVPREWTDLSTTIDLREPLPTFDLGFAVSAHTGVLIDDLRLYRVPK